MNLDTQSTKNVVDYLLNLLEDWKMARSGMEEDWQDAWASFISSPSGYAWLERTGLYKYTSTGDECSDEEAEVGWHHKIHPGKGFEIGETIVAYLMQATFSNERWFDVLVTQQDSVDEAELIRKALLNELNLAGFRLHFLDWLRQQVVTGTSAMQVSWCNKKCGLKFNPISNSRLYLQPTVPAHEADMFVAHFTTRRALKRMVGSYNLLTPELIMELKGSEKGQERSDMEQIREFSGVSAPSEEEGSKGSDTLTCYEYYGTVYDDMDFLGSNCRAVICGETLIHFETNVDCPIVAASFISILEQSWGISPTTASSGLLAADKIFLNTRLDSLYTSAHDAYTYREDGVIDSDWKVYPGAKIKVLEQDAIKPLARGANNLPLTYQEEAALDARINRNAGTVPTVGGGSVRNAERVTAQEIISAKQVGGTRMNQYHLSIELRFTNLVLAKAYNLLAKYGTKERFFKHTDSGTVYTIGYVPKEACSKEVQFIIRGSEAVLINDGELSRTLEFARTAAELGKVDPSIVQRVNWDYVLTRMADLWGLAEPKLFLVNEANPAVDEENQASLTQPQQNAINANLAADGGAQALQDIQTAMRLR